MMLTLGTSCIISPVIAIGQPAEATQLVQLPIDNGPEERRPASSDPLLSKHVGGLRARTIPPFVSSTTAEQEDEDFS